MTKTRIPAAYVAARLRGASIDPAVVAAFKPALAEAFSAVNGTGTAFTLGASDAILMAVETERRLADKGVPKALRGGASITVTSAGPRANSYKSGVAGTRYTLLRNSKGDWLLDEVERATVRPWTYRREVLAVTAAARDAIVRHAMVGVFITETRPQV